jgi:lipopolysaccharide transport system ATP-binding protein
MVGLIGPNGAGKSTLLRLIGGVGVADRGSIHINGRLGALIDLGAGFHPDLTGRENVYINGIISGLTRREVEKQFDSIVAFAELEEFIDNRLHTYSTGMQMRLAFAVAVHIHPEILLIDEVLSVGDLAFQNKCLERIAQFKAEGCTILLVSHSSELVRQMCDETIWLRAGQVAAYGPSEVVVKQYVAEMMDETRRRAPDTQLVSKTRSGVELRFNENRFGSLEIEIVQVNLFDSRGIPVSELESGSPLTVEIEYACRAPIPSPIFGITISREDGQVCFDTSTQTKGMSLPTLQGNGKLCLEFERLDLTGGRYYIDVGVYETNWTYAYDYHWHAYPLVIGGPQSGKGMLQPPYQWMI